MIKKIHIQNYKLFKSLSLEDLSKILLIGGKNNSGKTSVLEAVYFPLDCLNPGMFFRLLAWRGINSIDTASMFEPSYHNFDVNKPMIFEYTVNSSKKKLQYEFIASIFSNRLYIMEILLRRKNPRKTISAG